MQINDTIKQILIKIFLRLAGLSIIFIAICYTLSIVSFSSSDSSFNSASDNLEFDNIFGSFGAKLADLSLQIMGLGCFLPIVISLNFGIKIFKNQSINHLSLKLFLLPVFFMTFCLSLAFLPNFSWWQFKSIGGTIGFLLRESFVTNYQGYFFLACFSLNILLFSIFFDFSWRDWLYSSRYLFFFIRFSLNYCINNFKKNDSTIVVKATKKPTTITPATEDNYLPINENSNKTQKTLLKKPTTNQDSGYQLPQIDLLNDFSRENNGKRISREVIEDQSKELLKILEDFGVYGNCLGAKVGPVVTLHEFEPAAGTKAARVISLADDIARSMSAISARMSVIPGRTSIGIELPNPKRETIFLREMLESIDYQDSSFNLPIILGKNIAGEPMIADLTKMPHLLIAGTTGSGKSVGLNVMILSILFKLKPEECRFVMIDPKMLELSIYDGIPHLLSPVVTDSNKAIVALKWVVAEMEERYRIMSSFSVRNISGYNEKAEKAIITGEKLMRKVQTGYEPTTGKPIFEEIEFEPKKLPFIVVIVDEMADLMLVAGKEIEGSVQRLAQMARAAGIHLIMATQRPSVDVITGVIKANFPTRISFQVTSRIDSRTILGVQGAEQLLGQGDMIYMHGGSKMTRIHGPFCSDAEIEGIVNFIKSQKCEEESICFDNLIEKQPENNQSIDDFGDDENDLYKKAIAIIKRDKKPSISYLQRQLRIGYNKAANIIEKMEAEGIVSAPNISGKREILEE
jgi:S-DNA-T family DNA segregation ATPase FtsK/SpoIIIE